MISAMHSSAVATDDSTRVKPDTICIATADFDSMAIDIVNGERYKRDYFYMCERYLLAVDSHRFQMAHLNSEINTKENDLNTCRKQSRIKIIATAVTTASISAVIGYKLGQK